MSGGKEWNSGDKRLTLKKKTNWIEKWREKQKKTMYINGTPRKEEKNRKKIVDNYVDYVATVYHFAWKKFFKNNNDFVTV